MQFPPVEATTVYDQSNVKVNPNGFSFHISVFGDQRVGKSSLISRLKNMPLSEDSPLLSRGADIT